MRIYIIGLPGVGKSTVGAILAEKLGYTFIDLDLYIEQQAMLFVDEIFHLYGEPYFRALESNCLKEISMQDNIIVSCGGGIVKIKENKEYMDGPCIYLKANLDAIQRRIDGQTIERPLLLSKRLEDLYQERKDLYEAFKSIEIENIDLNKTVNKILEELELK